MTVSKYTRFSITNIHQVALRPCAAFPAPASTVALRFFWRGIPSPAANAFSAAVGKFKRCQLLPARPPWP